MLVKLYLYLNNLKNKIMDENLILKLAYQKYPELISDPYNPTEDDNKEYRDIWIDGFKNCLKIKIQEEQDNIEKSKTTIFPRTEQIEFTDLMREQSIGRQHREGKTPEIISIGEENLGRTVFAHAGVGSVGINLARASALAEECIRMVEVTPKVMLGMSRETSDDDILKIKENISESDAHKNPFLSESKIYDYHLSPQHVNNFEEPSDLQNLRSKNLTVEQMLEIKDSPLARQNNESQDAYKIRRKLQKTIIKHRNILFK